jgi:tetratricopeptide (TPR) repeat protein
MIFRSPVLFKPEGAFRIFFAILLILTFIHASYSQDDDVLILKDDQEQRTAKQASPEIEEEDEAGASNQTFNIFYEKWREFEQLYARGKSSDAQRSLNELVHLRIRHSIPKITELALAAIQLGNAALSRKETDQALNLYRAAAALDPSLPLAYFSQAKAHLTRGIPGLFVAIRAALDGIFAPLSTLGGKIYFYSKFSLILTAALLMFGFAFALAQLIKYHPLLLHDALEKYGYSHDPSTIRMIMWVILFLPALFFFGPLWLAPFWLMIFWAYGRLPEKILSLLLFVMFALAYPIYHHVIAVSQASTEPSIAYFIDVFSDGPSPKSISNFQKYNLDHPEDPEGPIMLAYLYKTDQRFSEAIEVLQRYILDHPKEARAYNNLASIYLAQGEVDTALRLTQKATELDRRNALYPFNLAALYRAKFNFQDAENVLNQARKMDRTYVKSLEEKANGMLVDALPSEKVVIERIEAKTGSLQSLLFNPFSYFTGALFLLSLFLKFGKRKKPGFARACHKCGMPFCMKCQTSKEEYPFCTQCLHIFIKKDGVSPVSRREKMKEIDAHSKKQDLFSKLSSLVLPGFGNLVRDQVLLGILILVAWFFLIAMMLFHWKYANLFYFESAESVRVLTLVCICFMGLVYLFANASLLKKSRA